MIIFKISSNNDKFLLCFVNQETDDFIYFFNSVSFVVLLIMSLVVIDCFMNNIVVYS